MRRHLRPYRCCTTTTVPPKASSASTPCSAASPCQQNPIPHASDVEQVHTPRGACIHHPDVILTRHASDSTHRSLHTPLLDGAFRTTSRTGHQLRMSQVPSSPSAPDTSSADSLDSACRP